ncbi:MAG TPA: ROK family protein [Rhizobiales bacterium]|nr:fructokinase [bacterium BMS3Bbin10]HDO52972.1 ROK family protein [Hyphomicrobiales bacterium]
MEPALRIGIDLGGTKIAGIALDANGETVAHSRAGAPRDDYRGTIAAITALIAGMTEGAAENQRIGIGIPGSVSPATGRVQNANSTWLNGKPLKQDLERALRCPVRLANDANCFALSEAVDGAGEGARCVFGVIIGTGCGGGLVIDRTLVDGPRGIGGEWGHNPLPWPEPDEYPGPQCWCGRKGCMETWVSGPGMAADHERFFGETLDAEDIASSAGRGCGKARQSLDRHASRLARGLAGIINIFDPDRIVLGGGLSNMTHLYEQLPGLIAPHIFSDNTGIEICPPRHGAESGVRGAAWLWGRTAV